MCDNSCVCHPSNDFNLCTVLHYHETLMQSVSLQESKAVLTDELQILISHQMLH